MRQLTPEGQRIIDDLAQRYGFSQAAVMSMLDSLIQGHGGMAQFNHSEFAGSGQWMRGGMIMISDMFNHNLKARIDGLCSELSDLLARQPFTTQPASSQSQSQSSQHQSRYGGAQQQQDSAGPSGGVSLFVPPPAGSSGNWWPDGLGVPTATGSQNNVRYAYFAGTRRLAIEINGRVTVYDTLDHRIGGVSQQQSVGGSLTFTSQSGLVNVNDLPVVSGAGVTPQKKEPPAARADADQVTAELAPEPAKPRGSVADADIFAAIERLAELKEKGILTEDEFLAKKSELLSRL